MNKKRENFIVEKKINRRSFIKSTLIAGATILIAGFPNVLRAQKDVNIGVIYPTSGVIAMTGRTMTRGVELACEEVNQAGGIKSLGGAKLVPIFADSEGKPEVGMAAAEKLIQQGVSCLFGCYQSAVTFATTQIAERYKTPHVVPFATADQITERGFKYTFRIIPPASKCAKDQTDFIMYMAEKTGVRPKTAAFIYENTLFGQTSSNYQKTEAQKAGLKIVEDISYPSDVQDLTSEISKLKARKPDVVYRTCYLNDAILVTKTMYELKFHCMCQMGIAGETLFRYIDGLGKLANYVFATEMWNARMNVPGAAETNLRFKKKYGVEMDQQAAGTYAAIFKLKEALEKAGSSDRETLRNGLSKLEIGPGEKGNIMPYGAKFDERGQNTIGFFPIAQIQDEMLQPVHPERIANRKPIWPAPKPF